jgi:hypothetical protein
MRAFISSIVTAAALAIIAAGCGSGTGPDSLSSRQAVGGGAVQSCTAKCHNSTSTISPDPVVTNGSGTRGKHIAHVQNTGIPCEKCHDEYLNAPSHLNGRLDTPDPAVLVVYFDATNPTGTWINDTGAAAGSCASLLCHGTDTLDWYGTGTANFQNCGACHAVSIGARRRVAGAQGDFGGNASVVSHHVTTTGDPVREQCLVCHDQSTHTAGTVRLRNADTGASIAFDALVPSSLEPFCLSCHDANGAAATFATGGTPTNPFNDGAAMGQAPNRAGVEIHDQWNRTYGHRRAGLTCIGNGTPATGCHGNGHGSAYVGLLARNLSLPSGKNAWYGAADEPDYDLCFTCHAAYSRVSKEAILGMRTGGKYALDLFNNHGALPAYATANIQTFFRDVNLGTTGKAYDDPAFFGSAHENLHMYHLQIGSAWNYRDAIPSSIVCVSCHSVHGSNTQWGWLHDTLLFSRMAGSGGDQFGRIGAALDSLGNYPTSCTFNCHNILGPTSSWFEPSDE